MWTQERFFPVVDFSVLNRRSRRGVAGTAPALTLALAVMLALGLGLLSAPQQAQAQGETARLRQDVERLRQDMMDLQSAVFGQNGQSGQSGASTGTSAATRPAAAAGSPAVARLQVQIQELSDQIRGMTGRYEALDNRLRLLEGRMDKLVADMDFRLKALEQGRAKTGVAGLSQTPAADPAQTGAAPADGVLPPQGEAVAPAEAAETGGLQAILADKTPDEQYQYAMTLLHQHDFQGAEASLRLFLQQNPKHKLTGNAMYWLGETYYARARYEEAASVFGETYIQDRNGPKAVHSLLKLAMSLENAQQSEAACTAYRELLDKHAGAEARVLDKARAAAEKLKCP